MSRAVGQGGRGHKAEAPGSLSLALLRPKGNQSSMYLLGPVPAHFTGEESEALRA